MKKEDYMKLIHKLKKWEYEYHCLDQPSVPDEVYDIEFKKLKRIEEEEPSWIVAESPSQMVGGVISGDFEQIEHKLGMLSLSNATNQEEREDFINNNPNLLYCAEVKLDGLAISLIYENGKLVKGGTRGTGKTGEDVTLNVKTIKNVPHQLIGDYPDEIEIRGEVVMPTRGFNKLNKENELKGEKVFKTSRNAAAGSLRNKDSSVTEKRPLAFFAYGIGLVEGGVMPDDHFACLEKVKEFGLSVPKEVKLIKGEDIEKYYENILEDRDNLDYAIDGVVIKVNSREEQLKIGFIEKSPKWAKAFKFPSGKAITRLNGIMYQTGRTGAVTPVADLEPVDIDGATFRRASLHNIEEMERLGIMIGDNILLERAQDVIPQVLSFIAEDRDLSIVKKIVFPSSCPVCGSPLLKEENKAVTRCTGGLSCGAQLKGGIEHFVSKKALDVKGLSDKLIDFLVEEEIIKDITDLYKIKKEDIIGLDRIGDKSAGNLIKSINKSKNTTLSRFIYGLGIREVGESSAKNLANHFGDIESLEKATFEDLIEINDIGEITANYIVKYFENENNLEIVNSLKELGIEWEDIVLDIANQPLKDKKIVLTGTFYEVKRNDIKERLEKLGAKVSSSVSANTDFLVYGEKAGSKLAKANDLGITKFNEEQFLPELYKMEKPANPVEDILNDKEELIHKKKPKLN